jgi:Domain of Unknown Function (DUF1206)
VGARAEGERVAHSTGFAWLSRSGFVARGVMYVLVGVLAIEVATGSTSTTPDQKGALETISKQPFGHVLLVLVAIGLGGYSLWRLTRAFLGHGPEDSDSGLDRIAAFASGCVYAIVCALAVSILLGSGGGSGSGVLGWSGGTVLVGIAGMVLIGVGLYQGYRGWTNDFLADSKTEEMSPRGRDTFEWLGTFGHIARMIVLVLAGVFLIKAAVEFDPEQAVGLDAKLAALAQTSYGPFLLGIVATGLIAFGAYSLADARYRRI